MYYGSLACVGSFSAGSAMQETILKLREMCAFCLIFKDVKETSAEG